MVFRAVLFDLDGTLLDTLRDIADSVNAGLASLGLPKHEIKAYRYFVGEGSEVLAFRALPEDHRDKDTVARLVLKVNEEYSRRWADNTSAFPGVPDLLDRLARNGVRAAVLSNKNQDFAELTVSTFLGKWHFDRVVGAQPAVPKKPDPTAALRIAEQMGIEPTGFLYLGDSGIDMKTAVASGMYAVGALWGYRASEELLANGAKALVKKPAYVLPLIERD